MATLEDFLQSMSNSAASNVSAPVDGFNWLLRKAGLPVSDAPFMGSDWMERKGLTRPVKQSAASIGGEAAGMLAPVAVAAKAPQIAKGLLQMGENAAIPTTSKQMGGLLIDAKSTPMEKFDIKNAKQSIQKHILDDDEYSDFGLRVLPDSRGASIGSTLDRSSRWIDGSPTNEQLKGTSTIGVNEKNIDRAIKDLINAGYQGKKIALVKGVRTGSGEDVGESIIDGAKILHLWSKD